MLWFGTTLAGSDTPVGVSGTAVVTSLTTIMEISGNGVVIANGDTTPSLADYTSFANVGLYEPLIRTYTIESTGTGNLTLTGTPKVTLTGNADFDVTQSPSSPIVSGYTTTFKISLTPSTEGLKETTVSIANDSDDNPYVFDISGTGIIYPAMVEEKLNEIIAAIAVLASNIMAIKTVIDTNLDATVSSRLTAAGTLATVTNLTNAPSNGDFTGAMKTSLNVATPAVTVSDKTGFSLSVAGILAIWHQLLADIVTASTIGKKIKDWVLGTDSKALISIDAQDLSGTLDVNAKKLNGATPNNLAAGAAMTLADDAITSAKFDETSAFPLKAADTGATQVARTGADSDTLETLSDQIDGVQTTVDAIAANSGKIVYGSVISTSGVKKTINAGSAIGFVTDEKD